MRDVTRCDLETTILGHKSAYPFFVAPAAMGRLAHPDGEKCLARVAKLHGFPYIVSFELLPSVFICSYIGPSADRGLVCSGLVEFVGLFRGARFVGPRSDSLLSGELSQTLVVASLDH